MHPFPHLYRVAASARSSGAVELASPGIAALASNAPAEFDGPGDLWSPETLLTAALADCFVLSFRSVAAASKLAWTALECHAVGTLDRVDRVSQFTAFDLTVTLTAPAGTDVERAHRLLEKSEQVCLISASLKGTRQLNISIVNG